MKGFWIKNIEEFKLRMRESIDSIKDELLLSIIGNKYMDILRTICIKQEGYSNTNFI